MDNDEFLEKMRAIDDRCRLFVLAGNHQDREMVDELVESVGTDVVLYGYTRVVAIMTENASPEVKHEEIKKVIGAVSIHVDALNRIAEAIEQ